uniref:Probable pectate lyase F n=1 Tax=Ditylenchus dipsaci TaxID=166011 RepID=A0A915ETQ0_9BILA
MHCQLIVLHILLFVAGCESQSWASFPSASGCTTVKATIVVDKGEGGSVANVVFGANAADGIHCKGSCNIKNVWWTDVGEDAATFRGGAKSASDKTFQHNGGGSVSIKNFQCQDCGKLCRACGNCGTQYKRSASVGNVKMINPKTAVVIINSNYGDTATIKKFTIVGGKGKLVCEHSQGNNSGKEPTMLGNGPNGKNCMYTDSDVIYQ